MIKNLFRDWYLLLLLLFALFIKLFSLNEAWVEQYYSLGFYPVTSKILRAILGWIPFSVGDLLYIAAFVWLVVKTVKLVGLLKRSGMKAYLSWALFRKYLKLGLVIYVVFSLFWGLNYYRQGITHQLSMKLEPYSVEELLDLTQVLQLRLNSFAGQIDSVERLQYNQSLFLFKRGEEAYKNVSAKYPFLAYSPLSGKASLFTPVGHWFGFTGYYNPFTAEAQLKTSIPVFLKPFVVSHEIAHQIGYAKENEASFVGFLTCKASSDINFLYSVYFEMYRDAIYECRKTPSRQLADSLGRSLHPRVKQDVHDLKLYLIRNKNFIEPFMTDAYDGYLKINNQPNGRATYNEVIAYLVAYMKKFGKDAI